MLGGRGMVLGGGWMVVVGGGWVVVGGDWVAADGARLDGRLTRPVLAAAAPGRVRAARARALGVDRPGVQPRPPSPTTPGERRRCPSRHPSRPRAPQEGHAAAARPGSKAACHPIVAGLQLQGCPGRGGGAGGVGRRAGAPAKRRRPRARGRRAAVHAVKPDRRSGPGRGPAGLLIVIIPGSRRRRWRGVGVGRLAAVGIQRRRRRAACRPLPPQRRHGERRWRGGMGSQTGQGRRAAGGHQGGREGAGGRGRCYGVGGRCGRVPCAATVPARANAGVLPQLPTIVGVRLRLVAAGVRPVEAGQAPGAQFCSRG